MRDQQLLDALIALCEGRGRGEKLEVDADVLIDAYDGLKEKLHLAKELEMARDEAQGMKPSVARKLNEKIRALEAELDTLRTNKKVSDLEKKVKFLEQELKQSYTTKNFTLKNGLLELEKQYRAHMNVDPAMAAFWADVTVLLDEKKDKESQPHFRGPPVLPAKNTTAAAAATAASTPPVGQPPASTDGSSTERAKQPVPAAAAAAATKDSGSIASSTALAVPVPAAAAAHPPPGQPAAPGVQMHVEVFNSIISEEAAGAATQLSNDPSGSSSTVPHAEMVIRQGGSFRIVKSQQQPAGDAAAAAGSGSTVVVEDSLQPVRVLADAYSSRCKDITFQALPASLNSYSSDALGSTPQQQQQHQHPAAVDSDVLESSKQDVCSSVENLTLVFDRLQTQDSSTTSSIQQQMQQLVAGTQQLRTSSGPEQQQQQQQTAQELLVNVRQLRSALEQQASSNDCDAAAVTAAQGQLSLLELKLQQLQKVQQQAQCEAESQQLLLQVFGEFLKQLEQQGVIDNSMMSTATAEETDGQIPHQQMQQQQPLLLQLLQGFLQVNQNIPHLVASRLQPAAAAAAAASNGPVTADDHSSPDISVSKVDVAVDAVSPHEAVTTRQLLPPSTHVSTQSDAVSSAHAETQYDTSHAPSPDISTQTEQQQQQQPGPSSSSDVVDVSLVDVMTQSDPVPSPSSHVSTQTAADDEDLAVAGVSDIRLIGSPADLQMNPVATEPTPGEPSTAAAAETAAGTEPAPQATEQILHVSSSPTAASETPPPPAAAAVGTDASAQPVEQSPASLSPQSSVSAAAGDASAQLKESNRPRTPPPPAAAGDHDVLVTTVSPPPLIVRDSSGPQQQLQQSGSGVIYAASGAELAVAKVAVGQQLDVLHHLQRRSNGSAAVDGDDDDEIISDHVTRVLDVDVQQLQDMQAVAKELSQLRADNMELAASLQVTKSLVDHLNNNMKTAIDKADDAEAEAAHIRHQLAAATTSLQQLQSEHAELTKLLIDAKVEIAEKKGELLKLVRNMRRAVEDPSNTAGMVKELQQLLAVLPSSDGGLGEAEGHKSTEQQAV